MAQTKKITGNLEITGTLIVAASSASAVQFGAPATPGWEDILGELTIRAAGANDPVFAVYRGNLRQFQFSNAVMNEMFFEYHMPHNYMLILARMYRDPADVADTLNQVPFVHYVDLHYQSSGMATKNKAPNFYA